ncbi:hypothetical protein QBC46DRAFT_350417 [Diplogelasinospora grovesii]|uniref:T6SS Phospholipase effector Tle1-like catalytic domain-containing protein n=1 Tax=Diplogelasinospora grovesii TaxID=303347 RepID=A0AAN6S875_9PEZI|nr:hypothetical protein QBC46DRAFT_350417 [Diplogelasinospora grovesii]
MAAAAAASEPATRHDTYYPAKRLIVCCDGTWMNADTGFNKPLRPSWFCPGGRRGGATLLQTPSNVTRIARSLKRSCGDSKLQVIDYHAGVGTGPTLGDVIGGGAFGVGVSENIRSAYSFVCANYSDGGEIILVGFSRGAFTARSVAGMIADLGLLTRDGMEYFYPIFKDMENWQTPGYEDPFPGVPFTDKPTGEGAAEKYRQMLLDRGLTRVYQDGGKGALIKVRAVGSLGIPSVPWLCLPRSTFEYRFFDTNLSDRVEYAFQALALDEPRAQFSPTVWERTPGANKDTTTTTTELRQVWFPGNHGNVGGGWADSGTANLSLVWMMDQLSSIGVEFDETTLTRISASLDNYYRYTAAAANDKQSSSLLPPWPFTSRDPNPALVVAGESPDDGDCGFLFGLFGWLPPIRKMKVWAVAEIYDRNVPIRPWGLGALRKAGSILYRFLSSTVRTPGQYKRVNPQTGDPTGVFLEDTNERIHSSVRIRLALQGLGLNDKNVWTAPALKGKWRLRKSEDVDVEGVGEGDRERGGDTQSGNTNTTGTTGKERFRWVWEYVGPEKDAPPRRTLMEEPLGRYERELLKMAGGEPNVADFAASIEVDL